MKEIAALLSDSDGTLVNTVQLIRHGQFEAATEYYRTIGLPQKAIPDYPTYEAALHQVVGGRTQDTMRETAQLLFADQPGYLAAMNFADLYRGLAPVQDRLAPEYITAYPGLEDMLHELGRNSIKFAIFTSGDRRMIVRNFGAALPQLGITDLYKQPLSDQEKMDTFLDIMQKRYKIPQMTVVTSDETKQHKPHPEGLHIAMDRLGVGPKNTAVMGDHEVDMRAGIAAGIECRVAVTHGFHDGKQLMEAEATAVINGLSEVPALLR